MTAVQLALARNGFHRLAATPLDPNAMVAVPCPARHLWQIGCEVAGEGEGDRAVTTPLDLEIVRFVELRILGRSDYAAEFTTARARV